MTLTIQPFVVKTLRLFTFGSLGRRDDRGHLLGQDPVKEILGGIAAVGNNPRKRQTIDQSHGQANVRVLSRRQSKAQQITQTIDRDMNLGAEASSATCHRLGLLTAILARILLHLECRYVF